MTKERLKSPPSVLLRAALWVAQVIVCLVYVMIGYIKLSTPISALSRMMAWTGQYPEYFVRGIGAIDVLGGIGILLPALTRIRPRLGVLAALGCTLVQVLAIIFHFSRGEAAETQLNFVLLPLCAFVLWGRWKRAPIPSR